MKNYTQGFTQDIQKNILKIFIITTLTAMFLIVLYPYIPIMKMPSTDDLINVALNHVYPYQTKKFVFLALVFIMPFYILILALNQNNITTQTRFNKIKFFIDDYFLPFIIAILLFFPFLTYGYRYPAIMLGELGYLHLPALLSWFPGALILLIFSLMLFYFKDEWMHRTKVKLILLITALIIIFLLFQFFGSSLLIKMFGGLGSFKSHAVFALIVSTIFSAIFCSVFVARPIHNAQNSNRNLFLVWLSFVSAFMLPILAWRIVCIHSITMSSDWHDAFESVVYHISQANAGKTALADFQIGYGLLCEIIAPLFKIIKFSIFKLSLLFAVMQAISLIAIFYVLSRFIKSRLLLCLAGFGFVMITFNTHIYFVGLFYEGTGLEFDRYFQYWPIRFFWPALSILAFYYFSIKKNFFRMMIVSVIGALGFLWNAESGLAIILSVSAYLFMQMMISFFRYKSSTKPHELNRWSIHQNFKALIIHIALVIGITCMFLAILFLKAKSQIHWEWLFRSQYLVSAFNINGYSIFAFNDPWIIVVGVYLIGFFISLHRSCWQHTRTKDEVLGYLSLLGTALFIYYLTQPLTLNLCHVIWPSFLISAILIDEMLYAIRSKILHIGQIWIPIVGVGFLFLTTGRFISAIPGFIKNATTQYITNHNKDYPIVQSELEFIKTHSKNQKECVILGRRSGVYYGELGLASPIKGPAIINLMFKRDQESLLNQIVNGKFTCIFLGLGPHSSVNEFIPTIQILNHYKVVETNSEGTMAYLQPL